jgi:hypothetical protein
MGRLIYLTLTSLDGFIGDGDYSWSEPDEEVMAALNADLAEVGTYLYGLFASKLGAGERAGATHRQELSG